MSGISCPIALAAISQICCPICGFFTRISLYVASRWQYRIATFITLTLTPTVKLTRTLNWCSKLTLARGEWKLLVMSRICAQVNYVCRPMNDSNYTFSIEWELKICKLFIMIEAASYGRCQSLVSASKYINNLPSPIKYNELTHSRSMMSTTCRPLLNIMSWPTAAAWWCQQPVVPY